MKLNDWYKMWIELLPSKIQLKKKPNYKRTWKILKRKT